MIEQIKEMIRIQNKLNNHLDKNWTDKPLNFGLAADVEMVEAIEHYGWKWWKPREADINQVKMEMVDIWHILLSWIIISKIDLEEVECVLKEAFDGVKGNFLAEAYYFLKLYSPIEKMVILAKCMKSIDMPFDELRQLYLGKSVLNIFRWNNGYNDGTYVKVWGGLEDNEYLTSIIMCHPKASVDEIYNMLEERYKKLTYFIN